MFWADKAFNGNSQVDNQMMDCSRPLIHSLLNPSTSLLTPPARALSSLPPGHAQKSSGVDITTFSSPEPVVSRLQIKPSGSGDENDITRDAQLLCLLGACVYKLQCLGAEVRRFYANTLSFQELFVELFIK